MRGFGYATECYREANNTDNRYLVWAWRMIGIAACKCNEITQGGKSVKSGSQLLKWSQEFQREHSDVAHDRLAQDLGGDRRSLVRNDAGR